MATTLCKTDCIASTALHAALSAAILFAVFWFTPDVVAAEARDSRCVAIFGRIGLPINEHFRKRGWTTRELHWGRSYTVEDFQKSHVVIVATHPGVVADSTQNDLFVVSEHYHSQMTEHLGEFVKGGGGLLIYQAIWPTNGLNDVNKMLAVWGAAFLDEAIIDPMNVFTQRSGMRWQWQRTTNIASHESTDGVHSILYPVQDLYTPAHAPLRTDESWQFLIQAMPSASSHPTRMSQQHRVVDPSGEGTYAKAPPLAAVRRMGEGTVAAVGWCPTQTFFNYRHFMVEDVYFTGAGEEHSDGLRFLEQLVDQLAAPAVKAGYRGPRIDPDAGKFVTETPVRWADIPGEFQAKTWRRGLIGARTSLTGGDGTPEDYAAAAQSAGFDFVAFLEDMSKLTPVEWDKFREDCRRATTSTILVMPGLVERRGDAETEYFYVGDGPFPPPDMRSADGKIVVNYLYAHFAMGAGTHGPFDVKRQRTPPWISRAYTAQSVVSTDGRGTTLEPAPYLYNVGIQDAPQPVAIDRIDSPQELSSASDRFVTLRNAKSVDELRQVLREPDRHGPGQVSNGPVIILFDAVNRSRNSGGRIVAGRERFQLQVQATSTTPLKELTIYNGGQIFRRIQLDGKTCDIQLNGVHDRQYMLTAVVADKDGHFAICGPLELSDAYNKRTICSDRQNSIGISNMELADGTAVEIDACLDQPKFQTHGDLPGTPGSSSTVSWVPWYWDGTPGPMFHGRVINAVSGVQYPEPLHEWSLVHRMMFPLGSRDVIVQSASTEGMCDKPASSHDFTPVLPLPYRAETRFYEFKKRPDAPSGMMVEGVYENLEDVPLTKAPWLYESRLSHAFYAFGGAPDSSARWSVIGARRNELLDQPFPPKRREHNSYHDVPPEGYVAFTGPQGSLAVFPMDEPLGCWLWLHEEKWLRGWMGVSRPGRVLRKGERVPYRVVVFTGAVSAQPDRAEIERFRSDFGLNGPPAYQVKVAQGRLNTTRYTLEVAANDYAFSGEISRADLVHDLPVRVSGIRAGSTCVMVNRRTGEWRPVGTAPDVFMPNPNCRSEVAFVALDLSEARSVWIGTPVFADDPSIHVTLFSDGKGRLHVEASNHTASDVETVIRSSAGCPLLTLEPTSLTIPAKSVAAVKIP